MGLGYVTLGQNTSSFSGGEAQRLKLLRLLLDAADQQASCLIFDEPSTGLSDQDVFQLLGQLLKLRDAGHTVIVVEHHLGLIRAADWLLELGPEAAADGGRIVYEGPPTGLRQSAESRTAPFLFT
jgi:excinuclease ABC subunit A